LAAVFQLNAAVADVAIVAALAGNRLVVHDGAGITAAAVVNTVALVVPQVVAAPLAFLGAMYQLYNVPAVSVVALYVLVVTLAVGKAGAVAPVQIYTS
jgi:hypothetical protein